MSDEKTKEEKKLTGKQKKFADYYLNEALFNATKAAELAGYKGDKKTLAQVGYENLRKPDISGYIEEKLEAHAMGVNETVARLAEIARGNLDDLQDENGHFDIKLARERNKTHLLKKVKQKRTLKQKKTEIRDDMRGFLAQDEIEDIESEVEIIYEEVEVEIHDSHAALRDIGKIHKLFTDKTEVEQTVNLPEQLANSLEKALLKAYDGEGKSKED